MIDFDPDPYFANRLGHDGTLVSRAELRRWLLGLAGTTHRMHVETLGMSTEGRPLDAVFVADDLSNTRFEVLRDQRARAIASLLAAAADPKPWTRPVALITSGIHATEVGGPQSIPALVHWMVTSEDPAASTIRRRVLTIIVPTLNPDGMDMVKRWHDRTSGTEHAGSPPPLLYHRFAGHDNNRDWLHRNLTETRVVLDRVHATWLPHVTLDQHQMNALGPRFVLPPYADPWEPHVHPSIIAASSSLGQAIASDMTREGLPGVATGRYFDAWEPSRAIQHYRGGVRILAEAANASLAWPMDVSVDQLCAPPMPLEMSPSTSMPRPWLGGTWRLRDIVDYHVAAARSFLRRVSDEAERWQWMQAEAVGRGVDRPVHYDVPLRRPAIDVVANRRLVDMLEGAGAASVPGDGGARRSWPNAQPLGPLLDAILAPKPYPDRHGAGAYDVTSHHLPPMLGATITARAAATPPVSAPLLDRTRRLAVIDSRCHAAPEAAESALVASGQPVWRMSGRELVGDTLIEPGSWIVERSVLPPRLHALVTGSVDELPGRAARVSRRDVVVLHVGDRPTPDHGWTRWWLHARSIPFLEVDLHAAPSLASVASSVTVVIADTPAAAFDAHAFGRVRALISAGATVIAFGQAGRSLASSLSDSVATHDFDKDSDVQAPGALVRLRIEPQSGAGLGLDRVIPAMFQRDGTFEVAGPHARVRVVARFAERDTVISGWMSHPGALAAAPAVIEVIHDAGTLHAFAFRPLFRAQMLVTSPLVHNLIYSLEEPDT